MLDLLTEQTLVSLADAANRAPSADNRHVVRLRKQGGRLQVIATDELHRADPTRRRLGLMSAGAVVENVVLRARKLGLDLRLVNAVPAAAHGVVAEIDARSIEALEDPLDPAIEQRHSNRRLRFHGPPLAAPEQAALAAHADVVAGTELVWLDAGNERRSAVALVRMAEAERFRNRVLHAELFGSVRFDVGWNASADEGLPPGALGLPWFEQPAFAALRHWPAQSLANALGAHTFAGWRGAALPCRLAPHLCVVTAADAGDAAAFQAGRLLQRVWLHATRLGLAFQVFAASPLYALPDSTAIDPSLRQRLAAGWRELCPQGRAHVLFRMGHACAPAVRAARRPARELLAPEAPVDRAD